MRLFDEILRQILRLFDDLSPEIICTKLEPNYIIFQRRGNFYHFSEKDSTFQVLRAKNPKKLESEINLDFARKETLKQYERDQAQKKRDQALKDFPDLPTWLLPYAPEDGPVEALEVKMRY